jgi:hypothetical protein
MAYELKKKCQEKFKNYFELNKNESTTYQNLGDAGKAVFKGKLIALNLYIVIEERCKINNLNYLHRKLDKEEQDKSKVC